MMKKLLKSQRSGMTLVEVLVGMVIGMIGCIIAYTFYRHFMSSMERQKQVTSLQDGIRNAVDCINRYLIAGGVAGDSLFFDPHKILTAPFVNGGHRVFQILPDSASILVYGNYSGTAATLSTPVTNKTNRSINIDKPGIFKVGGFVYIYAGSAQEVARVQSISGATLSFADDFFAPYPKGTLIFPLERISISLPDKKTLRVSREGANGAANFERLFTPSEHLGDSLSFKVKGVDREAGQISYALSFTARTGRGAKILLARNSDQTVFVRGF
jgi:type II secretory pathway pseudopilin PulG